MDLETQTQTEQPQTVTVTVEVDADEAQDISWELSKASYAATRRARDARRDGDRDARQDALADREYFDDLADRFEAAAKEAEDLEADR